MQHAQMSVDPGFRFAEVDPRLYGSFVEHMGRCVYEGIYEPDHPSADEAGFRTDVADLVRELEVPLVRYPGGNFVSGYRWEDGIGPVEERPTRLDLAWRSIETNHVGVDEFMRWARSVGTEPMMAVNLGTRGIDAARSLVEYCNIASGTAWSDLRRSHGALEPYGIKTWCLGNEMDGPWQIGHKTAREYGALATAAAAAMRQVDPSVELVVCGSSNSRMPTFGTWERTVLEEAYEVVDHVSMHTYYEQRGDDRDSFLGCAVDMDRFIEGVVATCDHVKATGRYRKQIGVSFDEWNVWYQKRFAGERNLEVTEKPPLIEDTYSVVDAVVVGTMLNSLIRHSDRVRIGCLAQLVNVIAPIRTEAGGPAWRQTIFHPYALTSRYGRGEALRIEPTGPVHDTRWLGEVPVLDAAGVYDEESGTATVFAVNRDQTEPMTVTLDLRSMPAVSVAEHTAIYDDEPDAVNTAAEPERVVPRRLVDLHLEDGTLEVLLPPLSWSMLRLRPA